MAQTVIITLTIAGLDTGPFSLYSNVDGYVTPFETGVTKSSLLVGYVSTVVPDAATIIRVKSVNELCTNYIDLTIPTTTTTTTSSSTSTTSTTSTSTSSTTTTTTTAFECADCRNWNYVSGNIPAEGDVIHWYSCEDGSPQSRALSFGDPDGNFCNCNSIDNPYSDNGTILTEIGTCVTTTSTTTCLPYGTQIGDIQCSPTAYCDENNPCYQLAGQRYRIIADGNCGQIIEYLDCGCEPAPC